MTQPTSTEHLRRHNTAVVLRALRSGGPSTRAELAKTTGLAKATIGTIVAGLEETGAVTERDSVTPAGRGRPGVPVGLSGRRYAALGLELNVDYVAAVALDLAGEVVWREVRPAGTDPVAALVGLASQSAHRIGDRQLIGTTVAVPGLVRADNRTVAWSPNLDINGTSVAARVGEATGTRVQVSNDANCAGLAEAHHGAAADVANALYLTGTVGIGAGIIEAGHLMRGGAGFAGEVGHLAFGDSRAVCGCGRRGCWEATIGLHALTQRLGMEESPTPAATARAIARRIGEPAVDRVIAEVAFEVGRGLAWLSSVLDPEIIVLGGYFVELGDSMLDAVRAEIDATLASPAQTRPVVRLSVLGSEAAAMGAAELCFSDVFSGEAELV